MFSFILQQYGIRPDRCDIQAFGTGLINHTWKVVDAGREFVLQRINTQVFNDPGAIAGNMRLLGDYLAKHEPQYLFVTPRQTVTGEDMVVHEESYYRLLPFVQQSVTYDVASSPGIAFEAARQFGCFTRKLAGLDASRLRITLPGFHDLSSRHAQFERSLAQGNSERIHRAAAAIAFIDSQHHIVDTYDKIKKDAQFKVRVTHHDTKISNVLFDRLGQGLCVIDLDTTMPGYFISDVGDMFRTYLCPASEEEKDHSKIDVREDFFEAIAEGYLDAMRDELSAHELEYFVYSGEFMIYMQALRFLTDYLNNDIYYGARYEEHNYVRAQNQMVLLQRFQEKGSLFRKKILMHAKA